MQCFDSIQCPVEATLRLVGDKYKALILFHLIEGPLRFHELQEHIPHATPKMLTQQLRELEEDGFLLRTVYPVIPPRVDYRLTPLGESFTPVLHSMCDWGRDFLARQRA